MSQQATWTSIGLSSALERATQVARHTTIRQAWLDLGWRWLAGLAGILALDLVVALPVWGRWLGLLSLLTYPVTVAWHIKRRIAAKAFPEEHAARIVEEKHPDLNNALINAVQFQHAVDTASEVQADLMRSEISRAEGAVADTPIEDAVSRLGERNARRALFMSIGAWIAAVVLLPGVVFTILPRIFTPWLDDITPPFSLTKIDVAPKGATVRYGSSLVVSVTVAGPVPETFVLATRTSKGDWVAVPLESTEPGKYALTLNDLREDTWFVAKGGGARSGRYRIEVVLPPVAETLQASYAFPAYTGRKEFTETVGEKGVHGLRDTKVSLQIRSNRELTGGELTIETEDGNQLYTLLVDENDPRKAIARFPITASGNFRLALAGGDKQVNSDAAHGKIVLERDQHPNVWFNEPPREIVVTPTMKVGLDIEADDDIGVQRIELHRVVNGIADNSATLYSGTPLTKAGARLVLDMADLGVRPGDEITYYSNAYDNDPGHPNFAQTEPYTIRVMSQAEYEELLKQQRDAQQLSREIANIKDALDSLAQRQEEIAETMEKLQKALEQNPTDANLAKKLAEAQQEQKKLQEEARQTAAKFEEYANSPSASEIEKALKEKVGEAAKAISRAAEEGMKNAQSSDPKQAARGAKQAAEALKKTAAGPAKAVDDSIKHIEEVAPLFQDVERFKALLDRQGQLVLQAREFEQRSPSDLESRSKMENLAAEQERVQEELKALQEDLRAHAAQASKHFPKASASAVKIADEIGKREIPKTMGNAADRFGEQKGSEGFAAAQEAFEQMQAMMGQAGQCQSQCKGELDISLSQSLGKQGLGQSLSECLNQGRGSGPGMGAGAFGSGGAAAGNSGLQGGSAQMNGPVAYRMSASSLAGKAGTRRVHARKGTPGSAAELSPDRVEVLANGERQPPKASDGAGRSYPAEYRKLIRDYFISVSKEKKR